MYDIGMAQSQQTKTTRLFFVRHGVTSQTGTVLYGRSPGVDLSDRGIKQAENLAKYFANKNIQAIFASPLERAKQTADTIAKSLDLEVTTREELLETDTGIWTGWLLKDCYKAPEWEHVKNTPSQFRLPEGESFIEVLNRMEKIAAEIVKYNEGKNVVVVGHNGPITSLLARYLGLGLDNYENIPCDTGSVSEVSFIQGIARLRSINILPNSEMEQ